MSVFTGYVGEGFYFSFWFWMKFIGLCGFRQCFAWCFGF